MIFIGYETSDGITITSSEKNSNEAVDTALAALKVAESGNSAITRYIIAGGESQENYIVFAYVDP